MNDYSNDLSLIENIIANTPLWGGISRNSYFKEFTKSFITEIIDVLIIRIITVIVSPPWRAMGGTIDY